MRYSKIRDRELVEHLQAELSTIQEQVTGLLTPKTKPEPARARRVARGTQAGARLPTEHPTEQATLGEVLARLEALLRERPRTEAEIERALPAVPGTLLAAAVAKARKAGSLYNSASEAHPRWWWRLGPDAPAQERYAMIHRMLSERPHELNEIVDAVGCTRGQASGCIVDLRRRGAPLRNLGDGRHALWYLAPV